MLCDFKGKNKQMVVNTILRILRELIYQIGIERGRVEEKLENAVIMIDKFKLSIDDITREFNLKKEELLEYMEQRDSQK